MACFRAELTAPSTLEGTIEQDNNLDVIISSEQIQANIAAQEILEGSLAQDPEVSVSLSIPNVVHEKVYTGPYAVIPKANDQTVLDTKGRSMTDAVTVLKIPYYEIGNESGDTVYIANEV